jgi:hypothetical protein
MNWKHIAIAACLSISAACSASSEAVEAPDKSYADMTFEERALFMNDTVLPRMKARFSAFDPKYADMTCSTCHGDGVSTGTYRTPDARIVRLPATEEDFLEYVKDPEKARWAQFMMEKVWPEMADILQVKMYDPTTHPAGFSCHNCHKVYGEP